MAAVSKASARQISSSRTTETGVDPPNLWIAQLRFDELGDPCGVERLGIALESEAEYELRDPFAATT